MVTMWNFFNCRQTQGGGEKGGGNEVKKSNRNHLGRRMRYLTKIYPAGDRPKGPNENEKVGQAGGKQKIVGVSAFRSTRARRARRGETSGPAYCGRRGAVRLERRGKRPAWRGSKHDPATESAGKAGSKQQNTPAIRHMIR